MTSLIACVVFAVCQGLRLCLDGREGAFFGGRVRLTTRYNSAAAFSLPLGRGVLAVLSPLALGIAWRQRRRSALGAGLLLGGGLSNLYERRRRGFVLDYLAVPRLPLLGRYACNAADLCIFLGCGLLALSRTEKGWE